MKALMELNCSQQRQRKRSSGVFACTLCRNRGSIGVGHVGQAQPRRGGSHIGPAASHKKEGEENSNNSEEKGSADAVRCTGKKEAE
ncbi:hypothetical protein NQZ68_008323 [Dissostichus eleginoides]|nr:hypothetical protein NQZ68_008323 [Dissostichus eleginoides]